MLAVQIGKSIYDLHAFQNKSTKGIATPQRDVDLIRKRYREAQELAHALLKRQKSIEFEEGSGNVFADLGRKDSDELYALAQIAFHVYKICVGSA